MIKINQTVDKKKFYLYRFFLIQLHAMNISLINLNLLCKCYLYILYRNMSMMLLHNINVITCNERYFIKNLQVCIRNVPDGIVLRYRFPCIENILTCIPNANEHSVFRFRCLKSRRKIFECIQLRKSVSDERGRKQFVSQSFRA